VTQEAVRATMMAMCRWTVSHWLKIEGLCLCPVLAKSPAAIYWTWTQSPTTRQSVRGSTRHGLRRTRMASARSMGFGFPAMMRQENSSRVRLQIQAVRQPSFRVRCRATRSHLFIRTQRGPTSEDTPVRVRTICYMPHVRASRDCFNPTAECTILVPCSDRADRPEAQ
jgi:hypothetical protein